MNVKLDENMPRRLAALLSDHGHHVRTVVEQRLGGASDERVFATAVGEGRMLVTLDRGFEDIRHYVPGEHAGILVLRVPDQRPSVVEATLRAVVDEYRLEDMAGCTVIAQPGLVRIRRPEPHSEQ